MTAPGDVDNFDDDRRRHLEREFAELTGTLPAAVELIVTALDEDGTDLGSGDLGSGALGDAGSGGALGFLGGRPQRPGVLGLDAVLLDTLVGFAPLGRSHHLVLQRLLQR